MSDAKSWKIGLSDCCMQTSMAEKFKLYAENGIDYMEISRGQNQQFLDLDFTEVKALMEQYPEVKVWSVHLPFCPFNKLNIASFDEELVKNTVEYYKKGIDKIASIGVKIAVIHPSGEPNKPEDREALLEIASTCFAALAEHAKQYGITVAVEDLPRTCLGNCSDDIKKLISKHPDLRVCFDTNHLLDQRNVDFVREIGDKIITLHVSDYDFLNERHWLPYEGKVNWVELVEALEEVGYNGVWMYEIGFKAGKNIDRDRDLTFDDFKENHKACISKKPFTPIGTPNHEGCMDWTYYTEPKIN